MKLFGKLRRLVVALIGFTSLNLLINRDSTATAQFMPNFFQSSPTGNSFPSAGWPFFGGLFSPQQQQQNGYTGSPLRPGGQEQTQQQNPFSNLFGGFPGFANPWYNPQQQQQTQYQQPQTPTQTYQPYRDPYIQQQPQYQNPTYDYTRPQQPSQNPAYPPPSPQQPIQSPAYQNQVPVQQSVPAYQNPSPQQQPMSSPTYQNTNPAQQQPYQTYPTNNQGFSPTLDNGKYRPDSNPSSPTNSGYNQNHNMNSEPYGQQETPSGSYQLSPSELVGNNRVGPQEGGLSQQLLPVAGTAPGQGWTYPDEK